MKKKIISLLTTAFILATSIIPVSATAAIEPEKVKITFIPEIQTKLIDEYIIQNNIVLDSFVVTVSGSNGNLSSGYIINEPSGFDVLWNEFVNAQKALLNEGISRNNESESSVEM